MRFSLSYLISVLVSASVSQAAIYRVPQDYTSIQSAMDSLQENDTVLVAPGHYAEALHAPTHSFWLIGTSNEPSCSLRAVVDPSTLSGSDTLACLTIPAGSYPKIVNMCLHNRAPMLNGRPTDRWGGIINSSTSVVLRNSHFDSLYYGFINADGVLNEILHVDSCRFTGCLNASVLVGNTLIASHSLFQAIGFNNLVTGPFTTMSQCTVNANTWGHLATFYGDSVLLSHCVFGPTGPTSFWPIDIFSSNALLESCVFENLFIGGRVLEVFPDCGLDSVIIRNCTFRACTVAVGQGMSGISVGFISSPPPCDSVSTFLAENNIFTDLLPNIGPRAMLVSTPARIERNEFIGEHDENYSVRWFGESEVYLRDNYFNAESRSCIGEVYGDARWNYWGDSTGPYHPVDNPQGLGAEVGDFVDFIPWLGENPLFLSDPPIVSDYTLLKTYPNPFNSSVSIEYALTREQDIRLVVYDVLGREVETLLETRQGIGVHRVDWNAERFASGVYVAKLSAADSRQNPQAVKLMLLK